MIVGGTMTAGLSKKASKTCLKMVQNDQLAGSVPKMSRIDNPTIKFLEKDARHLHCPHDVELVINIRVGDYNTHRVLVDSGSLVDIFYYPAFQQMRIDRERLILMNVPLVGF